jgi:DNA-directed RNA polymerase specialized sigma24 family protein
MPSTSTRAQVLSDPALGAALTRFVRARVPEADVDDVVQSTLADALSSTHAPDDAEQLRPWVWGIARNKIADFFRRTRREVLHEPNVVEETAAAESAPTTAKELLRWATRELPNGDGDAHTLEWMLREGAGEKLETIAAEENVPAPRVRQRVARLRKHFRARWAAQLAAAATLVAVAIVVALLLRRHDDDIATPEILPAPSALPAPAPPDALALRRAALDACDAGEWQRCLDGLDAAKALDAPGDGDPRVQAARRAATNALTPPAPSPTAPPLPSPTAPPSRPKTTSTSMQTPAFPKEGPPSKPSAPKQNFNPQSGGSSL